ncbi:hypothetical protein ACIBCM_32870 [Streptomyces sp. NPDC051018]|uniref:hypothetical protein n=1 Tax=Streptomyces sp. NPDC051018 TaxID=3365639 RepID=UPI00379F7175
MLGRTRTRTRTRVAGALAAAALTVGISQAPASAGETGALDYLQAVSYGNCWGGFVHIDITPDGSHAGLPNSDISGYGNVWEQTNCASWIDSGVIQWSGKLWRSGAWQNFGWEVAPWWGTHYNVTSVDSNSVRFRVCNVKNGVISGCARLT